MRTRTLIAVVSCLMMLPCCSVQAEDKTTDSGQETSQSPTLNEAEEQFQRQLENAVLTGFFTLDGDDSHQNRPERYEIRRIQKMSESTWLFQTRIKYGSIDTVLPIVVPVKWAGDTPLVSLSNFTIPGLGTFTCRVLFYEDRYAGTWQHGSKGGHMWGTIEKKDPKPHKKTDTPK